MAATQAVAEIFVGEESALLTGLGSKAEEAGAAQGDDAAAGADLEIVLGGVEGQPDRDLLAIVESFTSGFVGGDDEQLDLARGFDCVYNGARWICSETRRRGRQGQHDCISDV